MIKDNFHIIDNKNTLAGLVFSVDFPANDNCVRETVTETTLWSALSPGNAMDEGIRLSISAKDARLTPEVGEYRVLVALSLMQSTMKMTMTMAIPFPIQLLITALRCIGQQL